MTIPSPSRPAPPASKSPGFIAVATVEDDGMISAELASLIDGEADLACVSSCRSVRSALIRIPRCAPDVILMDLNLPDGSGAECAARLKQLLPATRIVAFTVQEDDEQVINALRYGISGYLLKRSRPDQILAAIRDVAEGGAPFTPTIATKVVQSFHRDRPPGAPPAARSPLLKFEPLTPREGEILECLAQGFPTKQISQQLSITAGTVTSHLKHIYEKLQVRSRTEAVIKYLKR